MDRPRQARGRIAIRRAGGRACCVLLAAGLLAPPPPPALAEIQGVQADEPAPEEARFTGRRFAGVDLPAAPQDADVSISALRATAWTEGATRRLLLEGRVDVAIGGYRFSADRGVVWIESVQARGAPLEQIALYLDNAREPGVDARFSQSAERLLVTAIVQGEVRLRVSRLLEDRAAIEFVRQGEQRFARYLAEITESNVEGPLTDERYTPPTIVERRPLRTLAGEPIEDPDTLARTAQPRPIFPRDGVIRFFGPDRTLVTGEQENALVITGGVVAEYADVSTGRTLHISGDSVVVFFDPGSVTDMVRFGPGEIRGVYIEGDVVATDGEYTLRGPRFYYDLRNNRGVALDAVFYTYDASRGLPLYVRADIIRQESAQQWSAGDARLANVAFFEPQFSIGATTVTITREPGEDDATRTIVDARDLSFRINGEPVLGFPRYRGDVQPSPLTALEYETENGDGIVRTEWSVNTLFGIPEEDLAGDLLLDYYFDRGPAVGADVDWSDEDSAGKLFGFYINDQGEDLLTSGAELEAPQDNRGMVLAEHRWDIDREWSLWLEGAWLSDERFVDAFFEGQAETRREFANSIYLRRSDERSLLALEIRGSFNDFTPNEYLMQSQGFQVERLPEASYVRVGDTLFNDSLAYTSETSLTSLQLQFIEPRARELGFNNLRRSQAAFGIAPDQSIADRLRAEGFTEDEIARFDTRHELSAPFDAGPIRVTPYAVGRFTAYDSDFDEFRGPDGEDDKARGYAAGGLTASTEIVRVDDDVRSELFDLNRIRHILEPSATIWSSTSSLDSDELPNIDDDVESLVDGALLSLSLDNTWQTKRGGPAQERSVDWLKWRTRYVLASGEVDRQSLIGRYFTSRPELSNPGEYLANQIALRLTEATALSADFVYDFDLDEFSTVASGVLLDHGHGFSSFTELRQIDSIDSTFVDFGAAYELSRTYAFEARAVYDADITEFQRIAATLTRRAAQWTLEVGVSFDDIQNDTSFSVAFRPAGFGSDTRERIFTREADLSGRIPLRDELFWRR